MSAISSAATSLSCAIAPSPNPLQISNAATITIVISNVDTIQVSFNYVKITVIYDSSTNHNSEDALTTGDNISAKYPSGWNPGTSSEQFEFKPQPGHETLKPGGSLVFVLTGFKVNNQVGATTVTLVSQYRKQGVIKTESYPLILGKFPQDFVLGELQATKPIVSLGDSTTLTWVGNQANYTLKYGSQTLSIAGQQEDKATYSYPFNLPATTTFLLTATPKENKSVSIERQYTVMVLRPKIVGFGTVKNMSEAKAGSKIHVYWQTQNATGCDLYINGVMLGSYAANIDPAQGVEVVMPSIPGTANLFLCAYSGKSNQNNKALTQLPTTVTLPISVYQFDPSSNSTPVGVPCPFQLVPSVDGSRLYVVGHYPMGPLPTGSNVTDSTPALGSESAADDASTPVGYLDFATNTYNSLNLSNYPIGINVSTPSVSRLAIQPGDARFLYWAAANNLSGNAVRIDTTNVASSQDWIAVYAVATGANNPNQFLALSYNAPAIQVRIGAYKTSDLSKIQEISVDQGILQWKTIWSVATNSTADTLLITTSLLRSWDQNLYRYDVQSNSITQIKLPSCYRSDTIPSYVVFFADDSYYCISGVDPDNKSQPVIAIVRADDTSLARRLSVPAVVRTMVASPDGYHLYATLANNTIVRLSTGQDGGVVDTFTLPATAVPWAMAFNPQGTRLYISDITDQKGNGRVWSIDISDGASSIPYRLI